MYTTLEFLMLTYNLPPISIKMTLSSLTASVVATLNNDDQHPCEGSGGGDRSTVDDHCHNIYPTPHTKIRPKSHIITMLNTKKLPVSSCCGDHLSWGLRRIKRLHVYS